MSVPQDRLRFDMPTKAILIAVLKWQLKRFIQ
jgi:hypothetical protein